MDPSIYQAPSCVAQGFPASAGMDRETVAAHRSARTRFPRERGDGPSSPGGTMASFVVSPRARGWTRCAATVAARPEVSPRARGWTVAHRWPSSTARRVSPRARGWTRSGGWIATRCAGFPRERGDGPAVPQPADEIWMVSPRARGWTRDGRSAHRSGRWFPRERGDGPSPGDGHGDVADGFPASAGMDPTRAAQVSLDAAGFPASAGMDPRGMSATAGQVRVSPRARGWTRDRRPRRPASARFPRERGDGPDWSVGASALAVGFPASAGMDLAGTAVSTWSEVSPRARGWTRRVAGTAPNGRPVSPRARGWTARKRPSGPSQRGFPASAGMDPCRGRSEAFRAWFPRERGDGPCHRWVSRSTGRFPRERGDGPSQEAVQSILDLVSPRARGWTQR